MVAAMRMELDGRAIVVIDDFLSGPALEHFTRDIDWVPYIRQEEDRTGHSPHRGWVAIFPREEVVRQPYYRALLQRVEEHFPGESVTLDRAYANSISFGE